MDPKLSTAVSRRIKSLFPSNSKQQQQDTNRNKGKIMNFAEKNRSKELKRLATSVQMDVSSLNELLSHQKIKDHIKLDPNNPVQRYVQWVIGKPDIDNHKRKENTSMKQDTRKQRKYKNENNQADEAEVTAIQDASLLTEEQFMEHADLHPSSKEAVQKIFKLKHMTEIQSKTFEAVLSGRDVLGRARTGTGKTLAFLLPALERVLQNKNYRNNDCSTVCILCVSPTRELATQIGDQAEKLITFHHESIEVQVMVGGTNIKKDVIDLKRKLPTILVATPGRLLDHMNNTILQNGMRFGHDIMGNTSIVVLDETDRLLDMGFRKEINAILEYLPKEKRQTLLFSATVPNELKQIMSENMQKDFIEVDCIGDGGGSAHTNVQVEQTHVIVPSMDQYVFSIIEIVTYIMNSGKNKIVVFFPTARMVGFFAEFFNIGLCKEVIELHSRKSQSYRNQASMKFRNAKEAILFTSDVSARGVDYPNVTHVIQFGIPDNREQYIHRLGRTGRAGKAGKGLLILGKFESKFLKHSLGGLDIPVDKEAHNLLNASADSKSLESISKKFDPIKEKRINKELNVRAKQAYQSFLGYYNGKIKVTNIQGKEELVQISNQFAALLGLSETPKLQRKTIGKMGLKGVKGIVSL